MGGLMELLRSLFLGDNAGSTASETKKARKPRATVSARRQPRSGRSVARVKSGATPAAPHRSVPHVTVLQDPRSRPANPYWKLRRWRQVKSGLYLGYFKTRIGTRHGVIKWTSRYDFAFYVHDVPSPILHGPHGRCFQEVKPGKFRVHFAQLPSDLNSGIFYIETLLMEAFEHGKIA
jgi:hypothetical protein